MNMINNQESCINDNYFPRENSANIIKFIKNLKPKNLKLYNYPVNITSSHKILGIKKPTNMYSTTIMYTRFAMTSSASNTCSISTTINTNL
jgi:hypothetical protein